MIVDRIMEITIKLDANIIDQKFYQLPILLSTNIDFFINMPKIPANHFSKQTETLNIQNQKFRLYLSHRALHYCIKFKE